MSIPVISFAGQNWTITPEALAVNEAKPSITAQKFILELTGVAIIDLKGNLPHDWRRETVNVIPDYTTPLTFAANKYAIPQPPNTLINIDLEQWAPFAAVSSGFEMQNGGVDVGFAVDVWRPTPFLHTTDAEGHHLDHVFQGIDVDVAVRNTNATLHRISYHITLIGRIVFLSNIIP